LTAAGIASSGLSDTLSAAAAAVAPAHLAAPAAVTVGTLTGETIALVNPQKNYAQFLLRALLPMIIHVVITLAAGYSVGSEFRRRDARAWLESAGGDPVVALVGKLAPLFGIFFLIMLAEALFLEGVLKIPFRGELPLMVAAASLLIVAHLSLLLQLLAGDLASGLGLAGLFVSPAFGYAGVGFPTVGMNAFCARLERDPAAALVHGRLARTSGARIAGLGVGCSFRRACGLDRALCRPRIAAHGKPEVQRPV
jgi:ABC-2 type transport system permease protein